MRALDRSRQLISPGSSPPSQSDDDQEHPQASPSTDHSRAGQGTMGTSRSGQGLRRAPSRGLGLQRADSAAVAALQAALPLAGSEVASEGGSAWGSGVSEALQRYDSGGLKDDSGMPASHGLTRGRSGVAGALQRQPSRADAAQWSAVNDALDQGLQLEGQGTGRRWAPGGCSGLLHSHVDVVLEQGLQHEAQGTGDWWASGAGSWLLPQNLHAQVSISSCFGCTAKGAGLWPQLAPYLCVHTTSVLASDCILEDGLQLQAQGAACR